MLIKTLPPPISQLPFYAWSLHPHRHHHCRPTTTPIQCRTRRNEDAPPSQPPLPQIVSASVDQQKQLTKDIKSTSSPDTLFYVLQDAPIPPTFRHLTTALHHLTRLGPRSRTGGHPSSPRNHHNTPKPPNAICKHPVVEYIVNQLLVLGDQALSDVSIANVLSSILSLDLASKYPQLVSKINGKLLFDTDLVIGPDPMLSILHTLAMYQKQLQQQPSQRRRIDESILLSKQKQRMYELIPAMMDGFYAKTLWSLAWSLTELECGEALADDVVLYCLSLVVSRDQHASGLGYEDALKLVAHVSRLAAQRAAPAKAYDLCCLLCTAYLSCTTTASTNTSTTRDVSMVLLSITKLLRNAALNEIVSPLSMDYKSARRVLELESSNADIKAAVQTLLRTLYPLIPSFDAIQLSTVGTALAYLQRTQSHLIPAMAQRATEIAPTTRLDMVGLCSVAWSLATLRYDSEDFLEAAAASMQRYLRSSSSSTSLKLSSSVSTLYALAMLNRCYGPQAQRLLPDLATYLSLQLPLLSVDDIHLLAVAGWSLMVAKGPPGQITPATKPILQALRAWRGAVTAVGASIPPRYLAMIKHVDVALRIECPNLGAVAPKQYDAFFNSLYDSGRLSLRAGVEWEAQKDVVVVLNSNSGSSGSDQEEVSEQEEEDGGKLGSYFQRQVHDVACSIVPGWQFEYWQRDLSYPVDTALPKHKIAIEADGPTHYATNTRRPLGNTMLKRRLLKQLGWRVVNIALFEWLEEDGSGGGSEGHKAELLRNKLEAAGVSIDAIISDLDSGGSGGSSSSGSDDENKSTRIVGQPHDIATQEEEIILPVQSDVALRAQRLDILKARQGKMSKTEVGKRAALRKTK